MQKILLALFLVTSFGSIYAQKSKSKDRFYLWTDKWESTQDAEKAMYFTRVKPVVDSAWQLDTYRKGGPMISCERFKDALGEHADGEQVFYHPSGFIDSIGEVIDAALNGDWFYYNDTGRIITQKKFERGRLISVIDRLNKKDSTDGKIEPKDDEKESSFPGGSKAWLKYLIKNMSYPEALVKLKFEGIVMVGFVVDAGGNIESMNLYKSVEFNFDEEALRVIAGSPKWIPATQSGRKVKSYKKQPLVFRPE